MKETGNDSNVNETDDINNSNNSDGTVDDSNDNNTIITQQQLCSICHIDTERAKTLLEAASGSLERAIEIHFSNTTTINACTDTSTTSVFVAATNDDYDYATVLKNQNKKQKSTSSIIIDSPNISSSSSNNNNNNININTTNNNYNNNNVRNQIHNINSPSSGKKRTNKQARIDGFFTPYSMVEKNKKIKKNYNNNNTIINNNNENNNHNSICAYKISNNSSSSSSNSSKLPNNNNMTDENMQRNNNTRTLVLQKKTTTTKTSIQDDNDNNNNSNNNIINNNIDNNNKKKKKKKNYPNNTRNDNNNQNQKKSKSFQFSILAKTLYEISSTTKRTKKINTLIKLFNYIIFHCLDGITISNRINNTKDEEQKEESIHSNNNNRWHDALILTYTIDLILGKLSVVTIQTQQGQNTNKQHGNTKIQQEENNNNNTIDKIREKYCRIQPPPLQISGTAVSNAIQTITSISRYQLRQSYQETGDLGDVAAIYYTSMKKHSVKNYFVSKNTTTKDNNNNNNNSSLLSVQQVHETLQRIASVPVGKGSQSTRQDMIIKLLRSCQDENEICFIVRILLGNMCIGVTIKTILFALAITISNNNNNNNNNSIINNNTNNDNNAKLLEETYNVCPRLLELSLALLHGGIDYAVKHCSLAVGYPIHPMLANPASSIEDVKKFMNITIDDDSSNNKKDDSKDYIIISNVALEWKYDGMRAQVHWDGTIMNLFSRHMINFTNQFPDVQKYILDAFNIVNEHNHDNDNNNNSSFVIDTEIVAVCPTTNDDNNRKDQYRLLPFQELATRRKIVLDEKDIDNNNNNKNKNNNIEAKQVEVRVFCFDILYKNGQSLLKMPFWERRKILYTTFNETKNFSFAKSVNMNEYNETLVQSTLEQAVSDGAEGLMIKLLGQTTISNNATTTTPIPRFFGYESGLRGKLWLKLKRDYVSGYSDTIDVVPIGAWWGTGRKAKAKYLSPVLLAIYDEEEGNFQSICRCMSFSDEMYEAMKRYYFYNEDYPKGVGIKQDENDKDESSDVKDFANDPTEDDTDTNKNGSIDKEDESERINCFPSRPPSTLIVTNENPPIWFKPLEVFEMSFADLSLSHAHKAASCVLGDTQNRGIALRFPRFKRRRPDKAVEEATTATQILQLFQQQSKSFS